MRFFLFVVIFLFLLPVRAQSFPVKPIRLVVPFAPGGSSSIVARSLAAEMEKGLGQPIVVDNKGGGGGNVAMQEVAHADPDGYTLIIGHIGSLAVNPFMYEKLPYDVDKDFTAVSLLAVVPSIFVVHDSVAERFATDDAEAVGSTPAEYAAFIKKEQARWSKVVRTAKIKAD